MAEHVPLKFLLIFAFFFVPQVDATTEASTPLSVGVVLPLSGPLAEYGVAARNGFVLAQEQSPELAKKVKFVFEDSAYDNKQAVLAYGKLRNRDRVDIVYLWGYGPVQAVAPIAARESFPLIAVSAEKTASVGRASIIRFNFFAEQLGETIAAYIQQQGFRKVVLVKAEQAFLNGIETGLRSMLPAEIPVEVLYQTDTVDRDFRTPALRLKTAPHQVLGVLLAPGQINLFYRQMAALHRDIPTFGTHYYEGRTEIEQAEGAMEGAVFPAIDVSDTFRSLYFARFGNDNRLTFAGSAYDFARMTFDIAQTIQARTPQDILAAYASVSKYSGACGELSYVDNAEEGKSFRFPTIVKRIAGDSFAVVTPER